MSSTTPYWSSKNTQSPTRSGCVTASITPATKLASVWRAAKPRIAAAIAPEASSEAASRSTPFTRESAIATPSRMITALEQAADEAQARARLGRDLAADDGLRQVRAAARERAVEQERGQQRDRRSGRRRTPSSRPPRGSRRATLPGSGVDMGGEVRRARGGAARRDGHAAAARGPGAAAARRAARAARGRRRRGGGRGGDPRGDRATTARTCTWVATPRRSPRCAPTAPRRCGRRCRPRPRARRAPS